MGLAAHFHFLYVVSFDYCFSDLIRLDNCVMLYNYQITQSSKGANNNFSISLEIIWVSNMNGTIFDLIFFY